MAIILKSKPELKLMRKSGRLAQHILRSLAQATAEGVTPRQLDMLARRLLEAAGAKSPFLGHHGYPATITVSVNEAVVHGIPSNTPFSNGDIASLDVGTILNGFVGDNATTVAVGQVSARAQRLMRVTEEALYIGIREAKVGNRTGDIGWAIQNYVEAHGYTVVKPLCGHGVGRSMWEDPQVPNHGEPGKGTRLKAGMTIAIEPMVNEGTDAVRQLADKWTYVTADGLLSAHYEHTVAILSDGPEILTLGD
jgi:methionyl aminopeptidase